MEQINEQATDGYYYVGSKEEREFDLAISSMVFEGGKDALEAIRIQNEMILSMLRQFRDVTQFGKKCNKD